MTHAHAIVSIAGDGIGPEVTNAVRRVISATDVEVGWVDRLAGQIALEETGELLPQATIDAVREYGVALKGPCTTPVGGGFRSVNVQLRKCLGLYAAVRPVASLPGVITRFEDVDLVVVRENTEGLYAGIEAQLTDDVATTTKVCTTKGCERIVRFAFQYALDHGRRRVTCLHKANIMKMTDGLFLRCAQRVHEQEFPQVEYDDRIIDAACMQVVQEPRDFDVIVCENFYGDLMSDLCAGLVGGLGVTPGANVGENGAVFEAVHGSAPDIAGQNKANPLALLMSAIQMLRYLGTSREDETASTAAEQIEVAYRACLEEGKTTIDLGGTLGTREFADAVIEHIEAP
jgi:isocitrate dehydrogenase (NAD+)